MVTPLYNRLYVVSYCIYLSKLVDIEVVISYNISMFDSSIKRFLKEIQMVCIGISNPRTFGQLGEDAVISNHIEWLGLNIGEKGAYLDIGCNHPWIGSNTFKFYKVMLKFRT